MTAIVITKNFSVTVDYQGHTSVPGSKKQEFTLLREGKAIFKSGWHRQSYWEYTENEAREWASEKIAQLRMCL